MNYTDLLIEADSCLLVTKEKPLRSDNGRIFGNRIAIRQNLSSTEKACVLAEELGHYYTSAGNILGQQTVVDRKQERRARMWSYNKMIGLHGVIRCYRHGCHTLHDMADHLEVTEEFLAEALEHYRQKYGVCTRLDNYIIYFEPYLSVVEVI